MLTCSVCGAECQNPLGNNGQNGINWIIIHTKHPHKIANDKKEVFELLEQLKILENKK